MYMYGRKRQYAMATVVMKRQYAMTTVVMKRQYAMSTVVMKRQYVMSTVVMKLDENFNLKTCFVLRLFSFCKFP
ncbi:hypothetical protein SLA2020_110010 [Shorea laevis]